ncbi:MAG: acetyl-CoA carboxylase biotin carboxylase subunit [Gemmatimonadetes bacterium]|nr:acetyl-CoA carboxylase biotin carboxylase subunit [Gemmatimonadota bacterium]NIR78279.1 acetyl-CoA carboxylase biotin carboxylase subunit [Gemmatimonadota bacterium]NIT86863.1 acetyl-CoA carboxylase biotin carboxylase subunit [Gemmatimonadota bacterium]NIU30731.1 acetyl-CoA carboxylase biotin carboxylase subunit [Gemmatimonadota bacterium]NIU35526.1 acetyl-CoA carboxylase biotin carboxylase subunit [Gemmatimonadota bacterium]
MFEKVLIANRGEIALRIIRACHELGVRTVAVYSEADRESLHVRFADEDVCIGPAPARESYLNIPRIIAAAEVTGAEAIHPGYGFLAENAEFAEICQRSNLTFIGPTADQIMIMGDKAQARRTMAAGGVPTIPGTEDEVDEPDEALEAARAIGFPVMIKASAGGGGKGMRIARDEKTFPRLFTQARSEAEAAFGDPGVYLERCLLRPRHVEFQIFGDRRGRVVHLGERDCSIQRRHQKLIEEAPSPALTPELREEMGEAAVRAAQAIDYVGAGTVEFLLDEDGSFYFMEMNTRIQVEHPVTEVVTGLDLVKEQIRVAAGEPLSFPEGPVELRGHAIEFRINAEDPERDFAASPGLVRTFHPPGGPGVRLDTHVYAGYTVPPYYDSLLAKLIVWGNTREEALVRARNALGSFVIEGVETTIPFLSEVARHPDFVQGDVDIRFMERFREERAGKAEAEEPAEAAS